MQIWDGSTFVDFVASAYSASDAATFFEATTSGTSIPLDASGTNFFVAYFSDVTGVATGMEWVVRCAGGVFAETIPQPDASLVAEATSPADIASTHTVTISVGGSTFQWSSTIGASTTTGASVAIANYWTGNAELGNGLVLRFFATSGHRPGSIWLITVSAAGQATITQYPQVTLEVLLNTAIVAAHTYFVRIASSAAAADTFTFSTDGAAFTSVPSTVVETTHATGNTELGNGLKLRFGSTATSAPGELWEIRVTAATTAVTRTPPTRGFQMCSARGICDTLTSICTCFQGYAGADWYVHSRAL
ncbi:MAG: hypothetical protein EOO65_03895 [Methanosarcinales archaeon]|nr:MAG: hypothetical protein EOO65_03895 [Methanosarcinales archaeon]